MEKPTTSTLHRLPVEILHIVFANLKPQDVTQVRLTCGSLADIALHHLVSEVHLVFTSSSFERMRQISRHPIVSKTVRSLFYEAEVIQRCHTSYTWAKCIDNPTMLANLAATRPRNRNSPAFLRDLPCRRCSVKELDRAYANYSQYAADQQMIIRNDHNSDLIQDAFSKFPNLDTIHMVREREMCECSRYLVREFEAGLRIPHGKQFSQVACGVSQLLSLLLGAVSTGRKLRRVTCDRVHWTFFTQRREVLADTHLAVEHLNYLRLRIATCRQGLHSCRDDAMCANLRHGSLRDFIAAAPHLKGLNIGANPIYRYLPPISLADAVGTRHWQYLERVNFAYLSTREEDLLDFCDSHAKNLVHLSIIGLTLTSGCWQRVFQQIRKTLRLRSAKVSGLLSSYDFEDEHDLDEHWAGFSPEVARKPRLRVAIEAYLLEGGDAAPMNLNPASYKPDDDKDVLKWLC